MNLFLFVPIIFIYEFSRLFNFGHYSLVHSYGTQQFCYDNMKDRRGIERGRCNESVCCCIEYEIGDGGSLCTYCGHLPVLHAELQMLKSSNITEYPRQENNSLEETILNGVEVNPNPQFDASLTSEYNDMSADKASSENLLNDIVNGSTNSVSTQANNFHQKIDPKCNDGIMRDIIHGNRFLHHPAVKSKLKNNLLLGLYVDDIELVNPLGKNRGIHKICLVYATIFNISVELRSKLSSIFLLGVANANSLKEHENLCLFLEDLIDDFNCLQNGIVVNGERYYVHLYSLHGDALALHQILGFKQSFSPLVKKNCMLCDENKSKYKSLVKHNMCKMRMPKEHMQWKEKSQLWGINRKSPLSDIIYFSPVLDSLFDPMHVLLEGLLPNNIQLLLSTLSSQGILNREALNKSIKKFEFCKNIKSSELPKPFTSADFKVKSTSKSVLTLAIHLPFWLRLIEDNNFLKCFRMLVAIVKIIWSQNVNYYAIQHVSNLIAQYIRTFSEIYPNEPITPKMHMLVHLANQLLSHGPGRVSSCIRFEAKHYVAKRKRFYNFKNLPLSVFDTFMIDMTHSLFHGNGTSVEINSAPSYKTSTIDGDIIMLKKINWMGHTFYIGNFIIIGDADNKPIFGMINLITLSNYIIYFHIKRVICCYDNLSMSYEIISIEHTQELLELGNLPEKYPLISFSHDGKQFIIIPSSRFIQFSLPSFSPALADYLQGKATQSRIHYYRKLFVSELSVYLNQNNYLVSKNRAEQKWGYKALEKAILTAYPNVHQDEAVKASYKRTGPLKWVISHLADRRRKQVTRKEGKVFVCETTSVDEAYNHLQTLPSKLWQHTQLKKALFITKDLRFRLQAEETLPDYLLVDSILCYEIGLRFGSNINSLMTAAKTIIRKLHRIDISSIDALLDNLSEGDQRLVSASEIDPFPGPYATLKDGEMIIYLPKEKKIWFI
ncbi:hypothetical protein Avbf_08212 [Armadillidium vulgare]|nr:hypothetical protein Avbf_08212 [Armadillidium vulgare]